MKNRILRAALVTLGFYCASVLAFMFIAWDTGVWNFSDWSEEARVIWLAWAVGVAVAIDNIKERK